MKYLLYITLILPILSFSQIDKLEEANKKFENFNIDAQYENFDIDNILKIKAILHNEKKLKLKYNF